MPVTFRDMSDGSIHTTFNSLFEMLDALVAATKATISVATFNSLFEMRRQMEPLSLPPVCRNFQFSI